MLTLPGDTPMQPPPRIYIVRRGDTLSAIAQRELGDASRWPEIFERNRDVISDPNRIFPDLGLPRFDGQGWWLGQAACVRASPSVVASNSLGVW